MKRTFNSILFLVLVLILSAQQISIPRIDKMPNFPTPYLMRNWKQVAIDYDNFVFDISKTGMNLPITKISTSSGINYPSVNPILMDTYVGQSNHGKVAEAINILPAIVGASLVGVNKSNHFNTNWVTKIKDFYNLKNGQNVYLNSYSTGTGNDWWYEVMPNVFFYQLHALYPTADTDFSKQFSIIADRQLGVVSKLGGKVQPWTAPNMNFRAFNLLTGLPLNSGVTEPESAGSIAWILYQAYSQTNDKKYLQGAELALDFLQNWTSNPSYEIQLPYGIAAAARMNAQEGTTYDLQKFMNWTFSSGQGTLRGWGCITGNWNGYDVSGLIGEANDQGDDYAFSMNGFQHAASLAPVAKYDKRFARAIAKWILNMANASRLFYNNGLPQANQEPASYAWSKLYDPKSCIPYESMKQSFKGVQPLAMGDAVGGGWATTDLSIYSGSAVGYLAAIIDSTNVKGILQIDLNKTDFRGNNEYPNYLYYNSTATSKSVELTLPSGNFDIYDVISETVLRTNVSGITTFNIDADNTRLLVIYPTGKTMVLNGKYKTVEGKTIDYHANYDFSNSLRIKAFTVSDTVVQKLKPVNIYCLPQNNLTSNLSYQWFENAVLVATTNTGNYNWQAPASAGVYQLVCKISENGDTISSSPIPITVLNQVTPQPIISDINFSTSLPFDINTTVNISAVLNTEDVSYSWSTNGGSIGNNTTANPSWTLPNSPGIYSITVSVQNSTGTVTYSKSVLIKDISLTSEPTPLIYYPCNGDTKNQAQDAFHATSVHAVSAAGANGIANSAYNFPSSSSYIYTPNDPMLNFQDKIAVSFWVKPDALPNTEQFILSHGSWEERYKISITPDKKVRWTVKTNLSTVDVDADTILQIGKFIHFTAIYTGYSLELYRNGKISAFKPLTGKIKTTTKSITIARKDEETPDYNFKGTVDEVRIYTEDLPLSIIQLLPNTFKLRAGIEDTTVIDFKVYPNPFSESIMINLPTGEIISSIEIYDLVGKKVSQKNDAETNIQLNIPNGLYFLKVISESGKSYPAKIIKK